MSFVKKIMYFSYFTVKNVLYKKEDLDWHSDLKNANFPYNVYQKLCKVGCSVKYNRVFPNFLKSLFNSGHSTP